MFRLTKKLFRVPAKIGDMLAEFWISLSRERIIVLGDSHAKVFRHINATRKFRQYFDPMVVFGATAMGMVNPNSKTDCLKKFRVHLERFRKNHPVIILLGEVDTGFVIWYRARKKGLSVESQFERSLENYFSFVRELVGQNRTRICLMSAPLPTIQDNRAEFGEIANLRNEVNVSLAERTGLTLRYNSKIREFCESNGLLFLDLDQKLLGDGGVISSKFLNENPLDHHCDHAEYSAIIVDGLQQLGFIA